jgi:hypothetical protein
MQGLHVPERKENGLGVARYAIVQRIHEQLAGGSGIIKTAQLIGCGVGAVHRIKREMATVEA